MLQMSSIRLATRLTCDENGNKVLMKMNESQHERTGLNAFIDVVELMKRAWIPAVGVVAAILMLGGVVWFMQTSPRFEIAKIGVRGQARLTPKAIVKHLNLPAHTNIFRVNLEDVERQLETLSWIQHAEVYRHFPNKLSIVVKEREPFALVKFDELYLIDQEGVILGSLASGSAIHLPIITGAFVTKATGQSRDPELRRAFRMIREVMRHPLLRQARKIHIECMENVSFFMADASPEIRLSLKNAQESLPRLEKMYHGLTLDAVAAIDLRFDRRIIVTQQKS